MSFLWKTLTHGLEKLRHEKSYCDFKLIADDEEFPCHRVVLAAVSPFFETMFNSDMKVACI